MAGYRLPLKFAGATYLLQISAHPPSMDSGLRRDSSRTHGKISGDIGILRYYVAVAGPRPAGHPHIVPYRYTEVDRGIGG